ncbi:hypothetical protein [Fictibacillus norfolkensis]|uniref:Uncharacterized protein n=1 Tax=Fictibacillus norfolkensis TaxID=2762233 RepID=A0ABR8SN54_9BACL|nr:hypothetical protein [Fictibacillus norfolkensis]MBD7964926.1 hypothetical protein [Fictibacillus norfolkensis]
MKKIEKAMQQAKTSIEVEGLKILPLYDELVRAKLLNQITDEEFDQYVLKAIKSVEDER